MVYFSISNRNFNKFAQQRGHGGGNWTNCFEYGWRSNYHWFFHRNRISFCLSHCCSIADLYDHPFKWFGQVQRLYESRMEDVFNVGYGAVFYVEDMVIGYAAEDTDKNK